MRLRSANASCPMIPSRPASFNAASSFMWSTTAVTLARKCDGSASSMSVSAWARAKTSSTVVVAMSVEQRQGAHLDARPRRYTRRACRIGECRVGHPGGTGRVAVIGLEHDHLVDRHVGEVAPTMRGIVHVARGVVHDLAREL